MKYKVTHTTKYVYTDAVSVCHNQVHLAPRESTRQKCSWHRLLIHPEPAERGKRLDYFGNPVDYFSIHDSHLGLTVTATSQVEVLPRVVASEDKSPTWETVAAVAREDRSPAGLIVHQFLYDSPCVRQLPELRAFAEPSFPTGRSIVEAATDLNARIHTEFAYDPRATTVNTPLEQVLKQRRGVCQDFAHLAIGCLRAMGLPARYVSGYLRTIPPPGQPRLVGADASHAWLSVYCGPLGWVDLDPTNNVLPTTDHLTVAWGRDYSDVCPIQGVFVGGGQHTMTVSVDVEPLQRS